jgi:hypothetical protein
MVEMSSPKALPPASTLWTPGIASSELHKGWVLAEKVRTLPVLALAAALQSRWLQTPDENSTFTICVWWCLEKATREKEGPEYMQALFDYLLESLCFSQMSTDFSAAVVNECAWVRNSRHYPIITKHILLKCCALEGEKMKHTYPRFRKCRSQFVPVRVQFSKAEMQSLQTDDQRLWAPATVYGGYPLELHLARDGKNKVFVVSLHAVRLIPAVGKPGAFWIESILQSRATLIVSSLKVGELEDIKDRTVHRLHIGWRSKRLCEIPFNRNIYYEEDKLVICTQDKRY